MTHPRFLIGDAAFGRAALNALSEIFDEVWQSVLPEVSDNAREIKNVRDGLATLVLDLARDGQLGALQITHTAGRLTRETLGIACEPQFLAGLAHQLRSDRRTVKMVPKNAEGLAALGICESLLLALTDVKILSKKDARDLLIDVAATHQEAAGSSQSPEKHHAVVVIVRRILAAKNGVWH